MSGTALSICFSISAASHALRNSSVFATYEEAESFTDGAAFLAAGFLAAGFFAADFFFAGTLEGADFLDGCFLLVVMRTTLVHQFARAVDGLLIT